MAESGRTKVSRNKKDIISELPGNIHENILGFLPIQDAVRTSILSTTWRHSWKRIPHLIFEDEFLNRMMDKLIQDCDFKIKAFKLVSVINNILLLHNGPIASFSLTIPTDECDSRIIHDYIDQWIPLLARKNIKQLSLEDWMLGEFTAPHFSSLGLTHLRLVSFWFSYTSASGGFTYLTNIELIDVAMSKQCIFDCPVLEKLTLVVCTGLSHTNFHAPNLKCLHQMCDEISLAGFENLGLENLTEFSCGLLYCLAELEPSETSNLVKVLCSLHKIEKIYIAAEFIQYLAGGGSPKKLPKPLHYLKTLNISDINLVDLDVISCLLCLIRSAPNLCNLNISAEIWTEFLVYEDCLKDYRVEDFDDFTMDQLEIVTFGYFKGCRAELELVKFLLAHAPVLKTVFIHRIKAVKKDVSLMIAEEMLQYTRASSRAQIRYLEQPVVDIYTRIAAHGMGLASCNIGYQTGVNKSHKP
ncbi:FBD domain-containing protein [Heracleum sosnowskyi]|uniref:FBD domain-containing protein n=1 Tax=Heracleum sosnowskyi TaxID=360622 RepID=A0AAD8M012_9APIA|nr:FBD domain-containing protein [Heracleum sosnowskyi]